MNPVKKADKHQLTHSSDGHVIRVLPSQVSLHDEAFETISRFLANLKFREE